MILPECRWMWDGVEDADSVVLNPHKWLGVGFDCTAYYVRDPEHLIRVMSTNPSYLWTLRMARSKTSATGASRSAAASGRSSSGSSCDQGVAGVRRELRRDLANARWLGEQVDAAPGWERVAPVPLQTVCFRHRPRGSGLRARAHNLRSPGPSTPRAAPTSRPRW